MLQKILDLIMEFIGSGGLG